jgi:hypothetical protein
MHMTMIRRLHRTWRAIGLCGGGLRRLFSGFGYYQAVKDILIGTTIFADQAHPVIPDFNVWINLDSICVHLRLVLYSRLFASIRGPALCSS